MRARTPLLAAAFLALVAACADAPVGPSSITAAGPSFNFSNGPDDLPNVFRFSGSLGFGIQDPKTDLIAVAGLPTDPKTSFLCVPGGAPFAEADIQNSGVRQEVIHWLATARDINLHVYTRTGFLGVCNINTTPIATGVGHAWYIDNDRLNSGDGANSWGFHMGGAVTLTADGSTSNLEAHNRFIIWPDGVFRRIHRQVRLSH